MRQVTTATFRNNIAQFLDAILASGESIEIKHKGKILRVSAVEPDKRLAQLPRREAASDDAEASASVDWSTSWMPKGDE